MILFRPVGKNEYNLIKNNEFKKFPPRLPEQPIFYPVINIEYAREIAYKWNLKDKNSDYSAYILKFEIEDEYINKYDIQTVGNSYHKELWIPSEELEEFNSHIIGNIILLEKYEI